MRLYRYLYTNTINKYIIYTLHKKTIAMSDNEWDVPPPPPPIMDQIAELELLVQNLKTKALAADNDMHASSIICSEQKDISNYLDTMEYSARCRGNKVVDDLISA